jgi:hypothetical protein
MSGTIYSYKPVSATGSLEGASTVVTLRDGALLELRRGTKTRWSARRDPAGTEPRKRWATLEEWKATLPEGAEVTVHGDPEAETAAVVAESEDIRRVRELGVKSTRLTLHTNKLDASRFLRECRVAERRRDRAVYAEWLRRYDQEAMRCRQLAEEKLAAAPYKWFGFNAYPTRHPTSPSLVMARRTEDGVFVPLFVDLDRNLFHIPGRVACSVTEKVASTLAELGLDRILLLRTTTDVFGLRMESL